MKKMIVTHIELLCQSEDIPQHKAATKKQQ